MRTPRLLLILALAAFPAAGYGASGETPTPPPPPGVDLPLPPLLLPDIEVPSLALPEPEPLIVVSCETARALEKAGWTLRFDGGLERIEGGTDKGYIPLEYVFRAGLQWKAGVLVYAASPEAVPLEMFGPIFKGISSFTAAARLDRAKVGAALAAWGLPPTVDGRRLYNPGGDATYFGLMMHAIFASRPELVAKLGVERTSQSLDLFDHAFGQMFGNQAPDIAQTDIDRARLLLLMPLRAGETPLGSSGLKALPDSAAMIKDYKGKLRAEMDAAVKAGDLDRRKDSLEALAVLNNLERQRFHGNLDLSPVPDPNAPPEATAMTGMTIAGYTPLASGLPGLLRVLDRVNGTPLTPDQQENLIKAFPMGDIVWRMGAQDLWKQGLTGKGVKVAVIDGGIGEHPELKGSIKSRTNLTAQRGNGVVSLHGTHVSGIIHALAPDAELRGYTVFAGEGGNRALAEDPDPGIIAAVHRAVKDGNQVINMSLGGPGGPSDALARVVEEYASKGVVFLIAAGNARNATGGVSSPSTAPSAITVGALDSAGRMSDYSSFGERFDPRKLTTVVKDVFMAPGSNIVSTVPTEPDRAAYAPLSGTSMATPAMTGISALLVQDMGQMTLVPNPIEAAQRLKAALVQSSTPMSLDRLPPDVSLDQPFFVVHPLQALEALRQAAVPVAGK
ncbi:MAG: hypothetical protein COV48_06395 [Elusimicrobia bacterium CG11_big_fil_rev_8_21_14_0_20_64_6]|nr:MAG: hypothetical protein COV48_06395 [Elusimicrobia bacterium CG11_big_fil_rev_8_21_14_0_20_64_6]